MSSLNLTANQAHVLCMLVESIDSRTPCALDLEPADIEDAWLAHAAIRASLPTANEDTMPATRIYLVKPKDAGAPTTTYRLIDCSHPDTAVRFVARETFECRVATAREVASLVKNGTPVETVGPEQQALPG